MGYFGSDFDRKDFFLAAVKFAVAIISTIALLRAGAIAIDSFNGPSLQTLIRWKPITIGVLENTKFYLTTLWRDKRMSYQFEMRAPASFLKSRKIKGSYFDLIFLDADGFKVLEDTVESFQMTQLVDDSGNVVGISSKGERHISEDDYKRIASWEVLWPRQWLITGEKLPSRSAKNT
jgi:hypothetical protein